MLNDQSLNVVELRAREAGTRLQIDRTKPKFGFAGVALHMDMRRFMAIASVEEKTVRTRSEDGRHRLTLLGSTRIDKETRE
jgi:hypothetical protein